MSARILVFGGTGLIGHELVRELAPLGTVVAPAHHEVDLLAPEGMREMMRRVQPAFVVNAAGYTMVDRAESEPDACGRLNVDVPALLAEECRQLGAVLVHVSTDYVFDGTKQTPYVETDEPRPLSVYGHSKLEGERAIAAIGGRYLIVRTSWIYGARRSNFALTMLRLARERAELAVVDDQIGAPTSASSVARGVGQMLGALSREVDLGSDAESAAGVYHMTGAGSTTWYEFARTILADDPRAIEQRCRLVRPISTAEYPTPARRPAYSVLDSSKVAERFGVRLPPWIDQWRTVAEQLRLSARSPFARGTEVRRADRSTG